MKTILDAWRDVEAAERLVVHVRERRGTARADVDRARQIRDRVTQIFWCIFHGVVSCPHCYREVQPEHRHGLGECVGDPNAPEPLTEPHGLGPRPKPPRR